MMVCPYADYIPGMVCYNQGTTQSAEKTYIGTMP